MVRRAAGRVKFANPWDPRSWLRKPTNRNHWDKRFSLPGLAG
jgi:hypothetical protein